MLDIDFIDNNRVLSIIPGTYPHKLLKNMVTELLLRKLSDETLSSKETGFSKTDLEILTNAKMVTLTKKTPYDKWFQYLVNGTSVLAECLERLDQGEVIEHVF